MARRRSHGRNLRRVLGAGAIIALGVIGWFFLPKDPDSTDDAPPVLAGNLGVDENAENVHIGPSGLSEGERARDHATPPVTAADGDDEGRTAGRNRTATTSQPAATRPAGTDPVQDPAAEFQVGLAAQQRDDLVRARTAMSRALDAGLSASQARQARARLTELANETIFSRRVLPSDPLVDFVHVRRGDTLGRIARRQKVSADLLAEVNNLPDKHFIREGLRLKVINGPFNAKINKSEHLMHIYLQNVYVRTYPVALGMNGGTPTGKWEVRDHLKNPSWVNPQTGERWHADDPENPIGEFWIGLEGVEGEAVGQFGYGIHGTIEPETIGEDVSMGCVRLGPGDIDEVYKLLRPGHSFVTVVR